MIYIRECSGRRCCAPEISAAAHKQLSGPKHFKNVVIQSVIGIHFSDNDASHTLQCDPVERVYILYIYSNWHRTKRVL